ncbi:endothelin-converting enzyme 1-like [Ornithodoros turicata]|uniref:endothelin-converting enzyme 1-like n=1 Tax=Ornithodoros turicata TaxID=34597 RepID=UPI00313917A5
MRSPKGKEPSQPSPQKSTQNLSSGPPRGRQPSREPSRERSRGPSHEPSYGASSGRTNEISPGSSARPLSPSTTPVRARRPSPSQSHEPSCRQSREKLPWYQALYDVLPRSSFPSRAKSAYPKTAAFIVSVAITSFVVLALLLAVGAARIAARERFAVCRSSTCIEYSNGLNNALNRSVHPCTDFYQFVCGRWDKINMKSVLDKHGEDFFQQLTEAIGRIDPPASNQSAVEKAVKFYKTCIDIASGSRTGVTAFTALLAQGNITWPALSRDVNVLDTMVYAERYWNSHPLFLVTKVRGDNETTTVNIESSSFALAWDDSRTELLQRNHYFTYFYNFTYLLTGTSTNMSLFQLYRQKEDIIMRKLLDALEQNDSTTLLTESNFAELSTAFNMSQWKKVFSELLGVPANDTVTVCVSTNYFHVVNNLTVELGQTVMSTFLVWGLLHELGHLFDARLATLTYGRQDYAENSATYRCMVLVETYMGMAISAAYTFAEMSKARFLEAAGVADHVKEAFNDTFEKRRGFNTSIVQMVLKQDNIFGPYGTVSSSSELDALYKEFPDMTNSLAHNLQSAIYGMRKSSSVVLDAKYMHLGDYYTIYNKDKKQLKVWPLMVLEPIFSDGITSGLQYGGFGSFLSSAYFESIYDTDEEQRHLLTQTCATTPEGSRSRQSETKSRQFYDTLSLPITWKSYLSAADNKDVRLRYMEEYSERQLFFLIFCYLRCSGTRTHNPGACNIPLSSFPAFSENFHCSTIPPRQCRP